MLQSRLRPQLDRWVSEAAAFGWMGAVWVLLFFGLTFQFTYAHYSFSMPLLEPIALFSIFAFALAGGVRRSDWRTTVAQPLVLLWLLLCGIAALEWALAPDWTYGNNDLRALWESAGLWICFLLLRGRLPKALDLFIGVVVLSAVSAQIIHWTNWIAPPFTQTLVKNIVDPMSTEGTNIVVGFFLNPNVFAGFLFWPILLLLPGLRVSRQPGSILHILIFALLVASVVMSLARGVMIGVILAIGFYLVILRKPDPRWMKVGLLVWGFIIAAAMATIYLFSPTEGFFLTLGYRALLWKTAAEQIVASPCLPWLGSGVCSVEYPAGFPGIARYDPHNIFLYMMVRYGWVGLITILATFGLVIGRGWKAYAVDRMADRRFLAAVWAGWVIFPFMGILDSYFTRLEWQVLFFLMLAAFQYFLDFKTSADSGEGRQQESG